jgi:hypothetical protein
MLPQPSFCGGPQVNPRLLHVSAVHWHMLPVQVSFGWFGH